MVDQLTLTVITRDDCEKHLEVLRSGFATIPSMVLKSPVFEASLLANLRIMREYGVDRLRVI